VEEYSHELFDVLLQQLPGGTEENHEKRTDRHYYGKDSILVEYMQLHNVPISFIV
jgi:hypothetical protein